jgi:signal transduction histidine kinase
MAVDTLSLIVAGSVAGGLVSLAMGIASWRNREMPAAPAFGLSMLAVSSWCFFAAAFAVAGDVASAYLLDRLARLSSAHVGPLLLVFVLSYAGYDEFLKRRWLAAFWLVPATYLLLSLTGPWHGFASGPADVAMVTAGGITAPAVDSEPIRTLYLLVAYVITFTSCGVLAHLYRRSRTTHRRQILMITLGVSAPLVASTSNAIGFAVHPGIDLTPITFTVTGLVMGWALFRYDFLGAAPVTTEVLVERLPDPVLVLDEDDRVVDHNPAAVEAFSDDGMAGKPVTEVAPDLRDHLERDDVYTLSSEEWSEGSSAHFYDPQVSTIADQHGRERGQLVVLRDVTGQQRRQDRLEALQIATRRFIAADTHDQIAELTVDFVERVMDRHAAGVFLADEEENVLQPTALTDNVSEYYDPEGLVLDADTDSYEAYTSGEQTTIPDEREETPFSRYFVFPIDGHGVLRIASRDDEPFASDDEQFASILSRTSQVALTQVDRENELRRSRASIERRSEQIDFFNGILRHNLRNALLVIQGRGDHLRGQVDDEDLPHLDVIAQWCEDLAALNDEIREINDTVTATESERFEAVDLGQLLADCVETIEEEYPAATVTLDVDGHPRVQANELAGRVLDSVLRNAVEHNDGDAPRVDVTARQTSDWVQVEVADDGAGMSDEMKTTVFERDLGASHTSNEFGLYFVSVVMNLYGGTVRFEDNEPSGTIACLEFQVAD